MPKSCLDHLKDGVKSNGYYLVYGLNGKKTTVYCDFTTEPGSAWTLVMSWAMENKNLPAFRSDPLTENAPVNENTPNWTIYRLSKLQMTGVKPWSTHWRARCSFDTFGVDYKDYLRGTFKDFDITTYLGSAKCKKIEFINLRGHIAYHKTVGFWQLKKSAILHTDSSYGGCQFKGMTGAVSSEDNFGFHSSTNPNFKCTSGPNATSQYWFGGYL